VRSYGQYCPVAKALDVIGDRWSLLIVRELLIRGPSRYTELRKGLDGIATNLLADRLRELEAAGVVRSEQAPPPVATTLYSLTERGQELERVVAALGRWGAPLLAEEHPDDAFRSHRLALAVRAEKDRDPQAKPVAVEVRVDGEDPFVVETVDGKVRPRAGTAAAPDAVISGPTLLVVALLTGRLDVATASARGLHVDGSRGALQRVLP
jgi:DNA-binding HxlR family transcriptional regulator